MSFRDDLIGGIRNAACSYIQGVGAANDWLQSIIPTTPDPPFEGGLNGLLCDDPTPPPQTPPQFSGGQCPGVEYFVYVNIDGFVSENPCCATGPSNRRYRGPIGPARSIPNTSNTERWVFDHQGGTQSITVTPIANNSTVSIDRVERADGQPDTCGDSTPIIPPFVPPTITVPVPDPGNPSGPNIDVDVTLFAPVVIGPNIFAPVRVQGPNFDIDGRINFQPNFNIEVGIGGTGGGGGTAVEPEPGDDFDPESPDEPPAADGRRIIGLIVTLDVDSTVKATELAQDGDVGSILVPRIAIAYLISNNGGVRVPLSGIDLKLRNTYIPVPPDVEVVSWRIHTEQGVTVQNARPVYGSTRPVD